jgi:3-methyladenine DNA glycosylase/8-oxoguanine DNA glycosylase
MWTIEFPLVGPGGEPVDLRRTFASHGVADLPPMRVAEDAGTFEATLPFDGLRLPRTLRVEEGRPGFGLVTVSGVPPGPRAQAGVLERLRHVLSLDRDLSAFYAVAAADPDLAWAARGAGRMIRSPTVFEDVVKTICTTNCAWSATVRMVSALVEHLGERAAGAPPTGTNGRAFPTPQAMAAAGEAFYRDVVRAGYRWHYLVALSEMVAEETLDLEALGRASADVLPDAEVAVRLMALPGVGPYAAAHVMMLLGRHSLLILDSWTRPTYARLAGKKEVRDSAIERRFRRYGPYAGLAFWLFLTRSWVKDDLDAKGP